MKAKSNMRMDYMRISADKRIDAAARSARKSPVPDHITIERNRRMSEYKHGTTYADVYAAYMRWISKKEERCEKQR